MNPVLAIMEGREWQRCRRCGAVGPTVLVGCERCRSEDVDYLTERPSTRRERRRRAASMSATSDGQGVTTPVPGPETEATQAPGQHPPSG